MHCTDQRRDRIVGLCRLLLPVALVLLLNACASGGGPASPDAAEAVGATPNPYLAEAQRVPPEARKGMEIARQAYAAGEFETAASELQELTVNWPELSGLWLNLGIVQGRAGDGAAAEESLRQAIAANDNNVFAWNQLAALLRDAGRFDEAEQNYRAALQRWPAYGDAHRNLGILYDLYLQQPQKALEHYRTAQELREEPDRQLAGWIVDLERRL